ncbi:response regulator FixJ [Mesorhizobium sangaii]|uniref:Two-component system response regulator FixJ n=1 Tax=Mesorhizobium sangaii TaxID=505389 RepID=A0A841PCT6_9HYPH|nr:response regulator FixJ [Mesorhizobium sangaii]MBB6411521.1 two-component system response regulator FixJ [Mesorhizobium sangaii]
METGDYIVHIVDDEEPVRKSLAFLLTMSGFAVKMHESATDFLAVASGIRNGVLVTDLRMPDMTGVELLRNLVKANASLPAVVITGHADVPMAVEAMKAGATDFIEKPFEDVVLIEAIQRAAEQLVDKPLELDDVASIQTRLGRLSDRERQVLSGVVAGLPNKSIAYDLNISPRTVEVHRANVMAKMQATSLPQLVRMALAAGFGPA